ncbi:hypothetical protein ICN48_06385 [Polynucleobacter sp. JS-Safj-400b-B2]|nr:hypothetical protein [Polynucleobacter sp. JS-Safj-400b-B2]MBU3625860.1 hypothetical protein [Polynucleobacter sp. JS-Safj-400b-B2]
MTEPEYIDVSEIADILGLSRAYVVNVLTKRMDFPSQGSTYPKRQNVGSD